MVCIIFHTKNIILLYLNLELFGWCLRNVFWEKKQKREKVLFTRPFIFGMPAFLHHILFQNTCSVCDLRVERTKNYQLNFYLYLMWILWIMTNRNKSKKNNMKRPILFSCIHFSTKTLSNKLKNANQECKFVMKEFSVLICSFIICLLMVLYVRTDCERLLWKMWLSIVWHKEIK